MTFEAAFGEVVGDSLPDSLSLPMASKAWRTIDRHRAFTFIEARRHDGEQRYSETLVVESENDGVPTQNAVGIRYRERLALTFYRAERMPEVHAVRADFPVTLHQNSSAKPPYRDLCLYIERWPGLRRTWTAEKHLERILWWLAGTASGTLHLTDQPLEQLYFQSLYEFVVPYDFGDRLNDGNYVLAVERRNPRSQKKLSLIGRMIPASAGFASPSEFECLAVANQAMVHGPIEQFPATLGELHDQLERRGGSLAKAIFDAIPARCVNGKIRKSNADKTLLVVSTPLKRDVASASEATDIQGFIVVANMAQLGVGIGALDEHGGEYWSVPLVGTKREQKDGWRQYTVAPVEIVQAFTPRLARLANGIQAEGPRGVLAGVGALGSEIFDLWTRSGWGQWAVVDPDQVRPHNLARYHAIEGNIGSDKVDVVKQSADLVFAGQPSTTKAIADYAGNTESADIKSTIKEAELIVDVTTTIEFPRDLSANEDIRRAVTVFVTPSGRDAVLMLEDARRELRLDCLEAQYYRHIISAPWGVNHLAGSQGHLWAGASCRDVSAVIPNELIGLHGANLAAIIRRRAGEAEAGLIIWHHDEKSGSLSAHEQVLAMPLRGSLGEFEIAWDTEIRNKVRTERAENLPTETGGILLGYFDLVAKKVYVVDALSAPRDSIKEEDGFIRGVEGLEAAVNEAASRTANVVRYIGEWHSHPKDHPSSPSTDDLLLLSHLALELTHDGQAAVMLIVGDDGETWLTAKEAQ